MISVSVNNITDISIHKDSVTDSQNSPDYEVVTLNIVDREGRLTQITLFADIGTLPGDSDD